MMTIILTVAAVLVLAILFMIFRVQSLISIVREDGKPGGLSNRINAILFPIFFVVGGALAVYSSWEASKFFLPEAASEHGKKIDSMFWTTMAVIGLAFVITHILLFYFPYKYQYKEDRKAAFYPENDRLELVWTIIPAITMAVLVFSGVKVWSDIKSEAPKNSVVLEIMGKQFNWEVRYPGADGRLGNHNYKLTDDSNVMGVDFSDEASLDDVRPTEIHLPKGRPVLFKIRARDVLHSVFLPYFRQKMDAVPGMPTNFWFVPTKTTDEMRADLNNPKFQYELACTEVCGRGHFAMKFIVVVHEEDDYNQWVAEQNQKPWLKANPDYLAKVPANLKEKALKIIGTDASAAAKDSTQKTTSLNTGEMKILKVSNK
jgi:cytochrome c oxidase subunit II